MKGIREIFIGRCREKLLSIGKNQDWLSDETGIPYSTIQKIFNGHSWPKEKTIEAFCGALNVTPQWLFGADPVDLPRDSLLVRIENSIRRIEDIDNLRTVLEATESLLEAEDETRVKTKSS